ncbi:MAG: hypothetical protein EAZ57_02580 [Cytophagales bacterium]|nr:MAG: hypothetical protein EAZ67_03045 [Cytophagales bacterium]TAF61651.1 MAG: hypothetical protein EAZ57_02580 [Cytophagales bacterium]
MGILKKILKEVAKDSSKGYYSHQPYKNKYYYKKPKNQFKEMLFKKLFGFVEDFLKSFFGNRNSSSQITGMSGLAGMINGKAKLTDDRIISIAAKNGGLITPASLCMNAQIPIDEAKKVLDNLQVKGVFEIDVDMNGNFVYHLTDSTLGGRHRSY